MPSSALRLFSAPDAFLQAALDALPAVLDRVMPQNRAQTRELPKACRELSALLTTERHGLSRPYWASPRLTSAYLRYFLPWNLVRLGALLPALDLGALPKAENPAILDMGSGPLTFPLALWISRPHLRKLPLTVYASDSAPRPLELGRDIFEALRRELQPDSPWRVRTFRAPLHLAPRQAEEKPLLITMGNVLNEWEGKGKQGSHLAARMDALVEETARILAPGGRLLAVEPGTRLGGKLIAGLRLAALGGEPDLPDPDDDDDLDYMDIPTPVLFPLSPCPHDKACPMLSGRGSAWCHLNAPGDGAPSSLRMLSREAGLDKDSVSLSFVLLGREKPRASGRGQGEGHTGELTGRIISDAFTLPGYEGRARYACTGAGLGLVVDSAFLKSGDLTPLLPLRQRDFKSGAWLYALPGREENAPRREGKAALQPDNTRRPRGGSVPEARPRRERPGRDTKGTGFSGEGARRGRAEAGKGVRKSGRKSGKP